MAFELLYLPNELIIEVFALLDLRDIIRCGSLCRRFRSLISLPELLRSKLVADFGAEASRRFLQSMPNATLRFCYDAIGRNLDVNGMTKIYFFEWPEKWVVDVHLNHQCTERGFQQFEHEIRSHGVRIQPWVDPPKCFCVFEPSNERRVQGAPAQYVRPR